MFLVPVFEETERLLQGLAFLLIDSTTGRIGNQCCLTQILVAIVQAAKLRPLPDDDVHTDSVAGYFIL